MQAPTDPPAPNPVGRPSLYTPALATDILKQIADGIPLYKICEQDGYPVFSTVYKWSREIEDFSQSLERAREIAAEIDFERMQEWAHDGRNDWMEARNGKGELIGWRVNGEAVQRSRLRVETLKWRLSKINPTKFAEMQRRELSGPEGGPIQISTEVRTRVLGAIFDAHSIEPKDDDADMSAAPEESEDADTS